ncbi:DUF362 domain-containing protein [bacterium]|nr:DUF362 domain-containing protein [bacterium]RQV95523.1 MAG: DUF362 domain-containing protein [bacterium]
MAKYSVYLGRCDTYSIEHIVSVIKVAMSQININKPIAGKIVIKPNLVMAHPKVATEGYTRPELIGGILEFLKDHDKKIEKIDIVEKSGLGITTAGAFRYAGYRKLKRKYPVRLRAMEEGRQATIVLQHAKIHPHLTIAKEMKERDFLIFAPKLKTNVLSQAFSGALKLNIGTVDSRQRMHHHHRDLPIKIVDILEAANPDLIITDGIRMAYGGNQMTQPGIDFGVIVVANNAVAHDMVCAKMLGLDPFKIDHILEAMKRGYGPDSMDQIQILGDYRFQDGQAIAKKLDFGFMPVNQYDCNFRIVSGEPYCIGGCQGIFLDWLHMIKDRKPGLFRKLPHLTVLLGKIKEEIEAKKVLLIGECATASTRIKAKGIVRIRGCPPSHKRIILTMLAYFLIINPLVRPSLIFDGFILYPIKKLKGWLINLQR